LLLVSHFVYAEESETNFQKPKIVQWLEGKGIHPGVIVVLVSMLPIFELRGSLPLALLAFKMPLIPAFILSVIGNMIPVIPYLYLLGYIADYLMKRSKLCEKFFTWVFEHTRKKGKIIEKYEEIGLVIFVGIPLPMTGAWSGAVAAFIFDLDKKKSIFLLLLGVILAGLIVTAVTLSGLKAFEFFIKH